MTPDELRRMRSLAEAGYSIAGAAQRLERPFTTVAMAARRSGLTFGAGWLPMADVQRLMGVSDNVVRHWRRMGWLTPQESKERESLKRSSRQGVYLRVTRRDLVHLVTIRESWPTFEPATIHDDEIRQIARRQREAAGGRWVSLVEIADMACIHWGTISKRIAAGWLSDQEWTHYGRSRYLWIPNGATLPPYVERPKHRPHAIEGVV